MRRLLASLSPTGLREWMRPLPPEHQLVAQAFDRAFYLAANADVAAHGADPLEHFMAFGWREGRDPTPDFSIRGYLEAFPEAAESGENPFVRWLEAGRPAMRPQEPPYGFRYDVIAKLDPLEDRLAAVLAVQEPTPGDLATLRAAVDGLRHAHITFSHDNYAANLGGLQQAIRRESARVATQGRDHLHVHPSRPWPVVRTRDDAGLLGVVLNGEPIGAFTAGVIAEALAAGEARSFAIHSLLGHAADETADILAAAGLNAGVFWLHDFASLCAGFHLLRNDVADCAAPPADSPACGVCIYGPWRTRHTDEHARLFERLSLTVAAPSQPTLDLWRASTDLPAADTVVLPHAVLTAPRPAPIASEARPFRLAYAGLPVAHKGWPIFRALASAFADDPRYAFHHLGARQDKTLPAVFTEVAASAANPLAMRDALLAAEIDAVLVWPLCRETFSFVAYEAVAAGCAVITGPDSGNVRAFVSETGHGQVLPDEAALKASLADGAILELGRAKRRPMLYDLDFSALSLDLAATPAS